MLHSQVRRAASTCRPLILLVASFCLSGCCDIQTKIDPPPYLQLIEQPDQRLKKHDTYFKAEEERIDRRKRSYLQKGESVKSFDKTRVGLALSGGGIRSAAFQLGLMSGLHKRHLLKGIDYLSAVSGGSWAAGAYKSAQQDDDEFFRRLDDTVEEERSKLCDDSVRKLAPSAISAPYQICNEPGATIMLSSYRESLKGLKKSLVLLDPLDNDIGYAFRETWRAMIQENFLQGVDNDIPLHLVEDSLADLTCKEGDSPGLCRALEGLKKFQKGANVRASRPYLIINGTHSEGSCTTPEKNFPFQFTADAIGSIADCGNTHDYCGTSGTWGISGMSPKSAIPSRSKRYQGVFLKTTKEDPISTLYLSHAMAISGAVAPVSYLGIGLGLMEWHVQFPFPDHGITDVKDVPYRKEYVLADGGHSENFGVLPLLERNLGIMIISDAAFDSEERFGDFAALKSHAKELLDQKIVLKKEKKEGDKLDDLNWITVGALEEPTVLQRLFKKLFKMRFGSFDPEFRDDLYDPDNRLRFNGQFMSVDHYEEEDQNLNVQIGPRRFSDICGDNEECRKKRNLDFEKHKSRYHGDGYHQRENGDPTIDGYFTRLADGAGASGEKTGEGERGKVIYVKPPRDLNEFLNYLVTNNYYHIYNYLVLNKGSFPCDKTFAVSYHNVLIQSYYLLGKFIAEEYLADELEDALNQWPKVLRYEKPKTKKLVSEG